MFFLLGSMKVKLFVTEDVAPRVKNVDCKSIQIEPWSFQSIYRGVIYSLMYAFLYSINRI